MAMHVNPVPHLSGEEEGALLLQGKRGGGKGRLLRSYTFQVGGG